ncbi:MAG: sulfurtransferase [Erythrobacter sp.]
MNEVIDNLVSSDWLANALGSEDLIVIDASHHLPDANRNAAAEFIAGHIPGARFLDLASLVDDQSAVPAAFPRADQFAARIAELGIVLGSRIVLYDDSAIRSAARAWLMFTAFGIKPVAILDGGLQKWRAEGRAIDEGTPAIAPSSVPDLGPAKGVRTKADVLANLEHRSEQLIDARNAERFAGAGPDAVHGNAGGHIPGSLNLPFTKLLNADGTYKSTDELRAEFAAINVNWDQPIIGACGSGVTASVLLFALHLIGQDNWTFYDGSWLEWGNDPETPKASGSA